MALMIGCEDYRGLQSLQIFRAVYFQCQQAPKQGNDPGLEDAKTQSAYRKASVPTRQQRPLGMHRLPACLVQQRIQLADGRNLRKPALIQFHAVVTLQFREQLDALE